MRRARRRCIYNPRRRAVRIGTPRRGSDRARALCRDPAVSSGFELALEPTTGPDHCRELARRALAERLDVLLRARRRRHAARRGERPRRQRGRRSARSPAARPTSSPARSGCRTTRSRRRARLARAPSRARWTSGARGARAVPDAALRRPRRAGHGRASIRGSRNGSARERWRSPASASGCATAFRASRSRSTAIAAVEATGFVVANLAAVRRPVPDRPRRRAPTTASSSSCSSTAAGAATPSASPSPRPRPPPRAPRRRGAAVRSLSASLRPGAAAPGRRRRLRRRGASPHRQRWRRSALKILAPRS